MPNRQDDLAGWLAQVTEDAIDADLPIIDVHHHLWPTSPIPGFSSFGVEETIEYMTDAGHNIVATVHVEAHANYYEDGPSELRCVGETEFVQQTAETGVKRGKRTAGLCAGIIGAGNMMLGADLDKVLAAHQHAAPERFKGIRFNIASDVDWVPPKGWELEPGLAQKPEFYAAFEKLAARNLRFETWIMHPQLEEVAKLADDFPNTTIILSHVGSPMGVGRFSDGKGFDDWKDKLSSCAARSNIILKLGGLHLANTGLGVAADAPRPRTSDEIAELHGPYYKTAIEIMGASRCMFESNFPVDGMHASATVLWNAFKKITSDLSPDERSDLFSGTAIRAYDLSL